MNMSSSRLIALGSLGAALIVVLPTIIIFWGSATTWITAPFRGAVEERAITTRGAYRIQAYEQFYEWQEQLGAIDIKLQQYQPPLDQRQRTECIGLWSARANLVSRYNAASRQVATQGKWMADELPSNLPQPSTSPCS